ncbi:T9SS type A sorting domain-containing protein [Gaetbulibacter jejuensis]
MKTKLLFNRRFILIMSCFSVSLMSSNFMSAQNLMLNPTCDDHGTSAGTMGSTSDNADAYDMTPNNEILDEAGNAIPSPYQAVWDNDALEDWLEIFYLGSPGSLDEQPGSTSDGNNGTRGVKLYDDGSPAITGCSRRLYQKVEGLTIGNEYTFSVESRSEATGTPSEVYLLNTEIAEETGINDNGENDISVDGYMEIVNDFDVFTTNSVTFTATNTFVVVYVRSLNSVDSSTEVFYDNFSLVEGSLSTNEFSKADFKMYPNPVKSVLNIETNINAVNVNVEVFSLLGKRVLQTNFGEGTIDVSSLTKGLYLVRLMSENNAITTKKIIIE